jgi:PIN domain nuclease of toxin-antitoxin system
LRFLVDTHCWLWFFLSPERLGNKSLELLEDESSDICFSVASAWEIVIKHSLGKLSLPLPPSEYIPARLSEMRHQTLAIELSHALNLARLPDRHKDPFDRILLSQAISEGIPLMTADPILRDYPGVPLLWAG